MCCQGSIFNSDVANVRLQLGLNKGQRRPLQLLRLVSQEPSHQLSTRVLRNDVDELNTPSEMFVMCFRVRNKLEHAGVRTLQYWWSNGIDAPGLSLLLICLSLHDPA